MRGEREKRQSEKRGRYREDKRGRDSERREKRVRNRGVGGEIEKR